MSTRRRAPALALPAAVLLLAGLLAGCGGGSHTSTDSRAGRLTLKVVWPAAGKLIPAASNSIKASLSGTATPAPQTLARPATGNTASVTFSDLPPGSVTLTATAFPNADATGVPQATGSAPATIVAGQTATVTVTMGSTIDHVEVTPNPATVTVGQTAQLTATPVDAAGNVVLVAPGNIGWASGATANATLNPATGATTTVTGVAATTAAVTITATESESGKSGTAAVTVQAVTQPTNTGPNRSAVDPTGRFLYIADNTARQVAQFKINADGSLSPLSPAAVSVALPPYSLLADPAPGSHFLYVGSTDNNNGAIYQFNINADGTLTPLNPAAVVSTQQPIDMVSDPGGKFLYDIDHNNGLRSFRINADGTLTQNGADITEGGNQFFSGAVTPDGKFLYVGWPGGIFQYQINADGTLTALGRSPSTGGTTEGISISPVGPFLFASFETVGASGVQPLKINADGTLSANGPALPFSLAAYKTAITPDGKSFYLTALSTPNNVVAQYHVNADGTLTALSPATVPAGVFTSSITVTPDGKHAYVTNFTDGTVSMYQINADGTLTPLSPPNRPG